MLLLVAKGQPDCVSDVVAAVSDFVVIEAEHAKALILEPLLSGHIALPSSRPPYLRAAPAGTFPPERGDFAWLHPPLVGGSRECLAAGETDRGEGRGNEKGRPEWGAPSATCTSG